MLSKSSFPLQKVAVQMSSPGPEVPAGLLVLILDQAQFVPQALAVAQQVTVLFQQPVVLLDDSRCSLLLPLVLLQLTHQLLS